MKDSRKSRPRYEARRGNRQSFAFHADVMVEIMAN